MREEQPARETPIRLAPLTLRDLTDELHFPRLLRVPTLALRPARIGIALVTLVAIALVGEISTLWRSSGEGDPARSGEGLATVIAVEFGTRLSGLLPGVLSLDAARIGQVGRGLLIDAPAAVWDADPLGVLILLPIMLVLWAIGAGAISRSAACEFAQRVEISWPAALAFGLRRWAALTMSLVLPLAFAMALLLLVALVGVVLLGIGALSVVGALVYPLLMLLALPAVVTLLGFALGHWMLAPAVACEGTDAIDAIQRVYHYVLHRALHLLAYVLALLVMGLLAAGVGAVVLSALDAGTASAVAWFAPAGALEVGATGAPARIIAFWRSVPGLLLLAYGVSYVHCAGCVMYLLIRDINDHQDASEIWMEGVIEGTQARATRAEREAVSAGVVAIDRGGERASDVRS